MSTNKVFSSYQSNIVKYHGTNDKPNIKAKMHRKKFITAINIVDPVNKIKVKDDTRELYIHIDTKDVDICELVNFDELRLEYMCIIAKYKLPVYIFTSEINCETIIVDHQYDVERFESPTYVFENMVNTWKLAIIGFIDRSATIQINDNIDELILKNTQSKQIDINSDDLSVVSLINTDVYDIFVLNQSDILLSNVNTKNKPLDKPVFINNILMTHTDGYANILSRKPILSLLGDSSFLNGGCYLHVKKLSCSSITDYSNINRMFPNLEKLNIRSKSFQFPIHPVTGIKELKVHSQYWHINSQNSDNTRMEIFQDLEVLNFTIGTYNIKDRIEWFKELIYDILSIASNLVKCTISIRTEYRSNTDTFNEYVLKVLSCITMHDHIEYGGSFDLIKDIDTHNQHVNENIPKKFLAYKMVKSARK